MTFIVNKIISSVFLCCLVFTATTTANGSEISKKENSLRQVNTAREVKSNIVGGIDVVADTYLWFAEGLQRDRSWQICGGSLVTAEYVLTAAHCVGRNSPTLFSYKIGALSLDDTVPNSVQETIEIENVTEHPNYNITGNFENDFALITLNNE